MSLKAKGTRKPTETWKCTRTLEELLSNLLSSSRCTGTSISAFAFIVGLMVRYWALGFDISRVLALAFLCTGAPHIEVNSPDHTISIGRRPKFIHTCVLKIM